MSIERVAGHTPGAEAVAYSRGAKLYEEVVRGDGRRSAVPISVHRRAKTTPGQAADIVRTL